MSRGPRQHFVGQAGIGAASAYSSAWTAVKRPSRFAPVLMRITVAWRLGWKTSDSCRCKHLDGLARDLGQQRDVNLPAMSSLPPEPAADERAPDSDRVFRQVERRCRLLRSWYGIANRRTRLVCRGHEPRRNANRALRFEEGVFRGRRAVSRSTITSASAKPCSTSPWRTLICLSRFAAFPPSWITGASGARAACGFVHDGQRLVCTVDQGQRLRAISGVSAATMATGSPI